MNGKVFIIAEAGVNHNGSIDMALRLVDAAAKAGVDAVKFQTFKADNLVSKRAQKANYQKVTTGADETQYEMLKKLELSDDDHRVLMARCTERGVQFLSSAFDVEGVRYLDSLGLPVVKVPSGEITNLPYLRAVAECRKPILLSTGMATAEEVAAAMAVLGDDANITLLHCTTEYPCPFKSVNLNAMVTMGARFGVPFGYSDHTTGIEVSVAAAALGASVLEKHFTLDRSLSGPDHRASLEPHELARMVSAIRHIESAMGDGVKSPDAVELGNKIVARKSIVARCRIRCGETLTEENLTVKRPGNGISPMRWNEIVGTIAKRDYDVDDMI